jgi:anti-sigma-K factor RskA
MNEQEFRELSAARALHALSPEEEREFSRALAEHPEWQSVVDEDRETAADLSATAPEVTPPESSRAEILDLISRTPQVDEPAAQSAAAAEHAESEHAESEHAESEHAESEHAESEHAESENDNGPEASPSGRRRLARWFVLAASVAALLVVSLSHPWGSMFPSKDSDSATAVLRQIEDAPDSATDTAELSDGASGALHWSDEQKKAVLVTKGMQAAPDGHDYELWIVRADKPISLGTMQVDREGKAAVLASGFKPGDALAVTVEQEGGSESGAPTTDPLFVLSSS